MSTHTPGPWSANDSNVLKDRTVIAIVHDPDDHAHLTPVSIANARLIAAAPELLEALKACKEAMHAHMTRYGPTPNVVSAENIAASAIAKTEGRP